MPAIFRLQNVFGKWCRPNYNSVVATFCHNISRDEPITISHPDRELELVHVDDVVAGMGGVGGWGLGIGERGLGNGGRGTGNGGLGTGDWGAGTGEPGWCIGRVAELPGSWGGWRS